MKITSRFIPEEVCAARAEDPAFADELGRIRAQLQRQTYRPDQHHPDRGRPALGDVSPEGIGRVFELIDIWTDRGAASGRHLRLVPRDDDLPPGLGRGQTFSHGRKA